MSEVTLPLFPLKTVLFPGGPLRLQIFEPRYLEMVRDCTSQGTEFGVCLIVEGAEAGGATATARVGTTARIVDFFTTDKGLLGIQAEGISRFKLQDTRVRDNGLAVGEIELLEPEPEIPVDPQFALLPTILEKLLEQTSEIYGDVPTQRLDDSSWVGCRLSEILPLELVQKQLLLECQEPETRLEQLTRFLPDLGPN
ncbi:MAG: LON peptidase substrate-binding domain-containing protein [Pseudomonadota bacterium]